MYVRCLYICNPPPPHELITTPRPWGGGGRFVEHTPIVFIKRSFILKGVQFALQQLGYVHAESKVGKSTLHPLSRFGSS